jgi:hypothetical protein
MSSRIEAGQKVTAIVELLCWGGRISLTAMPLLPAAQVRSEPRGFSPHVVAWVLWPTIAFSVGCLPSDFDALTTSRDSIDACSGSDCERDGQVAEAGSQDAETRDAQPGPDADMPRDAMSQDAYTPGEPEAGAIDGSPPMQCTECEPGAVETDAVPCGACNTGSQMRRRFCSPETCTWSAWTNEGPCTGVTAACAEGDTAPCENGDTCGQRVCSAACKWSVCVPKVANGCLRIREGHTDQGSNYRCCGTGHWQFCLPDCSWSKDCSPCNEGEPNFCTECYP